MELEIKTSIIDYIGEKEGGVCIAIGLTLNDNFSFESLLWIHPELENIFEVEPDFLMLFGVEETSELPFYNELITDIEAILPNKVDIFEEILNNSDGEDNTKQ